MTYLIHYAPDGSLLRVIFDADEKKTYPEVKNAQSLLVEAADLPASFLSGPGHFKVVDGHLVPSTSSEDLNAAKQRQYNAIDAKTAALIEKGFSFQGMQFSLSLQAQASLAGLDQVRNDLSYPLSVNTIDDSATFSIPDAATAHAMFLAAVSYYRGVLDTGTSLKTKVREANTTGDVLSVSDTR